jgi:hypothetical protein
LTACENENWAIFKLRTNGENSLMPKLPKIIDAISIVIENYKE